MMKAPIIKVENLSVTYNAGKLGETEALKNISMEIYPEEYVILFGPSGCGKSTLLYSMAGLEVPNSGRVFVENDDLSKLSNKKIVQFLRQKLGMIFQAFYLIPSLSVIDNIMLPQMFASETPAKRRERALKVLERFEITKLKNNLPTELSGGQQQRVAICRAVINNPTIIFADEPVGNLDSVSSEKVMDMLYELNNKDKKTIVLVTHDSRYLRYAHRVYYLRDGEIVREVSNSERAQLREEKMKPFMAHALIEFAKYYPHLDEANLKVKFLCHYLLSLEEERTQERLEKLVHERICNQLTHEQFVNEINKSYLEGGVGLYDQTAHHLAEQLDEVLEQAEYFATNFHKFPENYEILHQGIVRLRDHLLVGYHGHPSQEQIERLDSAIKARIEGSIDHLQFEKKLEQHLNDGGVGLHYQTAQEFSRRIEVFLITYPTVFHEAPQEIVSDAKEAIAKTSQT